MDITQGVGLLQKPRVRPTRVPIRVDANLYGGLEIVAEDLVSGEYIFELRISKFVFNSAPCVDEIACQMSTAAHKLIRNVRNNMDAMAEIPKIFGKGI